MDSILVQQARKYLDDLLENIPKDKSGEELINRVEWDIRLHNEELQAAIREALGFWLRGDSDIKVEYAIELIGRLSAVEYISELENIREDLRAGPSPLPKYWLSFVDAVLKRLYEVKDKLP